MDMTTFLNDQKLMSVFKQFDTDNSNKITSQNIYFAMQKLGMEVPQESIEEIIKKHDIKGDGVISFEEFKTIFLEDTQSKPKPFPGSEDM
jgi:Ca2+-binding EF-hand superfamily protein